MKEHRFKVGDILKNENYPQFILKIIKIRPEGYHYQWLTAFEKKEGVTNGDLEEYVLVSKLEKALS